MDDVELLVLTFYEFAEQQRLDMMNGGGSHQDGEHQSDDHASNAGAMKKPKQSSIAVNQNQEEKKYAGE